MQISYEMVSNAHVHQLTLENTADEHFALLYIVNFCLKQSFQRVRLFLLFFYYNENEISLARLTVFLIIDCQQFSLDMGRELRP